jgi:hypothetical protein
MQASLKYAPLPPHTHINFTLQNILLLQSYVIPNLFPTYSQRKLNDNQVVRKNRHKRLWTPRATNVSPTGAIHNKLGKFNPSKPEVYTAISQCF